MKDEVQRPACRLLEEKWNAGIADRLAIYRCVLRAESVTDDDDDACSTQYEYSIS